MSAGAVRYMFIVFYVFLEQHMSRGNYRRWDVPNTSRVRMRAGKKIPGLSGAAQGANSEGGERPRVGAQVLQ